jgi:hypothetical protein
VQAVLDLYKRSLAHSREGSEGTSISFAGSFAGSVAGGSSGLLGAAINGFGAASNGNVFDLSGSSASPLPAVTVACDSSLAARLLAGKAPLDVTAANGHEAGLAAGGVGAGSLQAATFSFRELPELVERLGCCGRLSQSLTQAAGAGIQGARATADVASDKSPPRAEADATALDGGGGSSDPSSSAVCWLQCVGGEAALVRLCELGLPLHPVARRLFKDASPQVGPFRRAFAHSHATLLLVPLYYRYFRRL